MAQMRNIRIVMTRRVLVIHLL